VFTDHRTGIEIIVPAGWLAVRVNEPEYYDAWVLPELSDPAYQHALAVIKDMNPNESRLSIIDMQEGHLQDGFVTNINLFWFEKDEISLEDDEDLLASLDSLSETMPDLRVLTAKLSATSSGIPIGITTSKMPAITVEGANVVVFYRQVFVRARTGVLAITLATTEELKETVFLSFDAMIESITLVTE
jgi:hypothetical protein